MNIRILILTDDADASRAWSHVLSRHDIEAEVSSYQGLSSLLPKIGAFHEIIVDHYDDAETALSICKRVRGLTQQPLLLFTYETDERYYIEAYRLGVEECIGKPVGIPLFVAKSRAWLRQVFQYQHEELAQPLTANGFFLDPETNMFGTPEVSVKLSNLESKLMSALMVNRGQVLETGFLARRVWSMYSNPDPRLLKNLVYRLRNKVEHVSGGNQYIQSVVGTGYVFDMNNNQQ